VLGSAAPAQRWSHANIHTDSEDRLSNRAMVGSIYREVWLRLAAK
jgi:hypothetical protein